MTLDPNPAPPRPGPAGQRVGPVWRDANVRLAPSLEGGIVELLLPDAAVDHNALRWVRGEEIVEGVIVSDVWFELAPGRWCSAVNFDQGVVAGLVGRTGPGVRP